MHEAFVLEWLGGEFFVKWSVPIIENGVAGASAFDFDGDGAAEIVYRDMERFFILDGRTGSIVSDIPFPSGTLYETPVIADIDKDCKTEIVLAGCNNGDPGFRHQLIAYECDSASRARPIWNQYQYHVTNVNDDGLFSEVSKF